MYATIMLREPLERVLGDWDFLQEKVIGRFSTFRPEGQNIYGIRRRQIDASQVVDPRKGLISEHYELGPSVSRYGTTRLSSSTSPLLVRPTGWLTTSDIGISTIWMNYIFLSPALNPDSPATFFSAWATLVPVSRTGSLGTVKSV